MDTVYLHVEMFIKTEQLYIHPVVKQLYTKYQLHNQQQEQMVILICLERFSLHMHIVIFKETN